MRTPLADRFWKRVRKTPGCWEWTGGTSTFGHGRMRIVNPKTKERFLVLPHRVSYMLHVGDVPLGTGHHGTCVCHTCDNPRCVRPSHLYLGTARDNNIDAFRKGRIVSPQPPRKITFRQAEAARRLYWVEGGWSQRTLAARYGLERTSMRSILRGDTYKAPLNRRRA